MGNLFVNFTDGFGVSLQQLLTKILLFSVAFFFRRSLQFFFLFFRTGAVTSLFPLCYSRVAHSLDANRRDLRPRVRTNLSLDVELALFLQEYICDIHIAVLGRDM